MTHWLATHMARIGQVCNSLERKEKRLLQPSMIPGIDYLDDDHSFNNSKHSNEKDNFGYYSNHDTIHKMYSYPKTGQIKNGIFENNRRKTLPVSVIVSDRSSYLPSIPSPTSSLSDTEQTSKHDENVNNDTNHTIINHQCDEDDTKEEQNKNNQNNMRNRGYTYKPQPMVKKSQRQFIAAEKKDSVYWERRKRNNEAAKKSRESRREKEIEVNRKCKDLERENIGMKIRISNLQERNLQLEDTLKLYKEILIKNNLI